MKKLSLTTLALAFAVAPAFAQPVIINNPNDVVSVQQQTTGSGVNAGIFHQQEDLPRNEQGYANVEQLQSVNGGDNFVKVYQNQGLSGEDLGGDLAGANPNVHGAVEADGVTPLAIDFTNQNIGIVQQEQPDLYSTTGDPEVSILELHQYGNNNVLMGAFGSAGTNWDANRDGYLGDAYEDQKAAYQFSANGGNFMEVNQGLLNAPATDNQVGLSQSGSFDQENTLDRDYDSSIFNSGFNKTAGSFVGNNGNLNLGSFDPDNYLTGNNQPTPVRYTNFAKIDQVGSNNKLGVRQQGYDDKESERNELEVHQGASNSAFITQRTDEGMNSAQIKQDSNNVLVGANPSAGDPFNSNPFGVKGVGSGASNVAGSSNAAYQAAAQDGNNILRVQQGNDNVAGLYQQANANLAANNLSALANQAYFTQSANNLAAAHQVGGVNYVEVVQ